MDQLYPLSGPPCNDIDLDDWVDKTIESEIQRGKKLQELKQSPTTRNKTYHVTSIGETNFYSEKKRSKYRNRSPTKCTKKVRNNSPHRRNSPTRKKKTKSDPKYLRCTMRTAELAVPSKRHCIETWRSNYHILPEIMIERLKQHVLDMTPVVKVPDALEAFKRCKNSKRRKRASEKSKETKNKRSKNKEKRDSSASENYYKKINLKSKQIQNLCIFFGHKIAKKLYRPSIITLNSELEKIFNVVTLDIEHLLGFGKNRNCNNSTASYIKNKNIQTEVIRKITVWISEILDATTYKLLEDQLLDLEEEVGPVLDFLDELIENVLDICEPVPECVERSSSSETYNLESSTDYVDDTAEGDYELKRKESLASMDLDIYIKKELDIIIDSFDRDNEEDTVVLQDDEDKEDQNKMEQYGDIEVQINEYQGANENIGAAINDPENEENTADQGTEVNETIHLDSNDVDDDDLSKKVKFSEKDLVKNYGETENEIAVSQKSSFIINQNIVFAEPNDNLLNNADESWPNDISSAVIRPSASISKSISSLGFLVEAEERTSIMLFEDASARRTESLLDTTSDAKPLDKTGGIINDITSADLQLDQSGVKDNTTTADINKRHVLAMPDQTEIGVEKIDDKGENEEQNMKLIPKEAQIYEEKLAQEAAKANTYRASTDSTFVSDVSTEPLSFENTLSKVLEDEASELAAQLQNKLNKIAAEAKYFEKEGHENISYDEPTQAPTGGELKAETSDKTTYTSFSLIPREEKGTSVMSQSLGDIAKRLAPGKAEFSSLRIKPKVEYKVNKNSAPAWVTQNFGEPSPKKEATDKHMRLWCKDLQTGFENLELWNEWIENTIYNFEIMDRDKVRMQINKSQEEFIRKWMQLTKNVDADVITWIKHSESTQEKLKCFRKVYKNFQKSSTKDRTCNCMKK